MKKISLIFIIGCIITVFTSCTIAPKAPTDGIWFNEELKLILEFGEKNSVYSYDENLSGMDLQLRIWIDGGFDIICDNGEGEIVEIYQGWRKYKSDDKFIIRMYSKANSEDNYTTQIELDDEECIFVRIESYDEISELISK